MQTTVLTKMVKADNQLKKRVVVLHLDLDIEDEQSSVLAKLKRNSIALLSFGEQAKPDTKVYQKAVIRNINNQQKKIVVTIDIEKDIPEERWLMINRLSGIEVIEFTAAYCEPDEEGVEDGQMNFDEVHEGIPYQTGSDGIVELTGADLAAQEFEAAKKAAEEQESF